jgi:hypothetical protein
MDRDADPSALDEMSKNQSQRELHLPRRVCISSSHGVRWHLAMSWEIIDSKLFSGFDEACGVAFEAIFTDHDLLVVPVQKVERLSDEFQFEPIAKYNRRVNRASVVA